MVYHNCFFWVLLKISSQTLCTKLRKLGLVLTALGYWFVEFPLEIVILGLVQDVNQFKSTVKAPCAMFNRPFHDPK